jgi:hypothetical protein
MFLSVWWHDEPGAVVGPTIVSILEIALVASLLVGWSPPSLSEVSSHAQCFRRTPAKAPFPICRPRVLFWLCAVRARQAREVPLRRWSAR